MQVRPTRASSPAHPELLGPRRPPGRTSPNPRAVTAARPPSTQGRGADGQRDPSRGPPTLPPAVGRAPGPRVNELGGRRPESAAGAGAAQGRQGRPREPAERAPHAGQVSGGETRHSVGVLGGPGNSAPPLSFLPSGGGRRTRSGVQTRQNHGRTRTRSEEKPVHGGQRHAGHGVWGERHVRPGLPPGNPGQVSCSNVTSAGESPAPSPSIPISAAVEVGRGRGAGGTARGRRPGPEAEWPRATTRSLHVAVIFAAPSRRGAERPAGGAGGGAQTRGHPPRPPRAPSLPAPARGGARCPAPRRKEGDRVSGPGTHRPRTRSGGAPGGRCSGRRGLRSRPTLPRVPGGPDSAAGRPHRAPGPHRPARPPLTWRRAGTAGARPTPRGHALSSRSRSPRAAAPAARSAPTSRRTTSPPRRPPPARLPARPAAQHLTPLPGSASARVTPPRPPRAPTGAP